jgi:hypothetical protein
VPGVDVEVKLSDTKTIVLRPVNMLEKMTASVYASALAAKVNAIATTELGLNASAICSIRSVNGQPVDALSSYLVFQSVAQDIDGTESYKLVDAYITAAGLGVNKEPGNDLTPTGS